MEPGLRWGRLRPDVVSRCVPVQREFADRRPDIFLFLHPRGDRLFPARAHEDLKTFAPITSESASILAQGIGFRENVRTFSLSILTSLSDALELRFPFLSGHSNRVGDLSTRIGERMGLAKADLITLRHAAELHDVGIVGIPGNLLAKKRRLNEQETEMVRKHPFMGSKMLEGVPGMDATRRAILEHHEHFDGSSTLFDPEVARRIPPCSRYRPRIRPPPIDVSTDLRSPKIRWVQSINHAPVQNMYSIKREKYFSFPVPKIPIYKIIALNSICYHLFS